jgi:hypothetical protein
LQAKIPVNAQSCATIPAFPLFLLCFYKLFHPFFLDKEQIIQHAHSVFCGIAFVKIFEPPAGIPGAIIAKSRGGLEPVFAMDYGTSAPQIRLIVIIFYETSVAAIFLAHITVA